MTTMKKKTMLILLCALSLLLAGCGASNQPAQQGNTAMPREAPGRQTQGQSYSFGSQGVPTLKGSYQQIDQDLAKAILETQKDYVLVDVRTQEEFNEGHIPGAVCIPNETIDGGEISLLPSKTQMILVYCRSGNRSLQAAQKLADMGYANVLEFGGINTWEGEIVTD